MTKENLILVVDDEVEIRTLLARFLTRKGFTVLSAGTLQEGIHLFRQKAPGMIFLDVNLPDGNGLKELKSFKNGYEKKIIMMSAFDNQEVRKEAMKNGAFDFLSKPFSISKLNELVQNQI
ncbi:response regulator [Algoriphagus marinus]|uniref:response regulator n=1 Tax=Algoriphagus marinus TaxID=1925762 RepID=UPI00094BBD49|nr:response regulator [Algoriphagus marinus]